MYNSAIQLEEQRLNLFPEAETMIHEGWVIKMLDGRLFVCPLYQSSFGQIDERIRYCEDLGRRKKTACVFRVIEQTNYYLNSRLEKNGYQVHRQATIAALQITEDTAARLSGHKQAESSRNDRTLMLVPAQDMGQTEALIAAEPPCGESDQTERRSKTIGFKRDSLLLLFGDSLCAFPELEDILAFCLQNNITDILADLPGCKQLPEPYAQFGFQNAYTYCCYQKAENSAGI